MKRVSGTIIRLLPAICIFLFLAITITQNGYAQETLLKSLEKKSLQGLKAYIKDENKVKNCDAGECKAFIRFDREILRGYREVWGDYVDFDRGYELRLIAKGNALIYWRLDTVNEKWESRTKDSFIDRKEYNRFLQEYRSFYGVSLNEKELFISPQFALGGCGEGGYLPDMYEAMDSLVSTKNIPVLVQWLRSVNIETQLYAIEAYSKLALSLSADEKKIISYILSKDAMVHSCDGCDTSDRSVRKIANLKGYVQLLGL
ncbi:MAG TPA: hypothetical protein VEB40_01980 [Flavipsychrobacter sp.]|nr:hypothetical protein [Flavipsychrobacter sp.]